MGNFAQQTHPLVDAVELTIQRVNSTSIDTVTVGCFVLHRRVRVFIPCVDPV